MALDIASKYPGKSNAATAAYPFGSARNITTPGDGTGTPLEKAWLNDLFGFQQALINGAGLTPSGNADTAQASQYLEAARIMLGAVAKSVAELEAISASVEGQRAFLSDGGRSGPFNATLTDISTQVSADPLQGVYVAFASDPTGASGGWVREILESITPDMFGAKGNDSDDDYLPLRACNLFGWPYVWYPGKTYYSSQPVPFASRTKYRGVRFVSSIRGDAPDLPVACSQSYLSTEGIGPTGYLDIDDIRFAGEIGTVTGQIAFILRDYYSKIGSGCAFVNCRGGGFHALSKNDVGVVPSGTLVENKIGAITVRGCGGIGVLLGEDNNNKLTDGFAEDMIISLDSTYGVRHLSVGSAAGWRVLGFHTYGKSDCSIPVRVQNTFNTEIDGYIESFSDQAAEIHTQTNTKVTLRVKTTASVLSGANVVRISRSSAVSNSNVSIGLELAHNGADVDITAVFLNNDNIDADIRTTFSGDYKSRIQKVEYGNLNRFQNARSSDINLRGRLSDNYSSGDNFDFNGFVAAYGASSPKVTGSFTFDIQLPRMQSYRKTILDVSIIADTNDAGAIAASWVGKVCVSSKLNGTDNWTVKTLDMTAASGFTSDPSISISQSSDNSAYITVSGTLPASITGAVNALIPAPYSSPELT